MGMQSNIKAGEAWISLGLLTEDFDKRIALQARKFQNLARKMQSIGRQMAVAGLVFSAPFLVATRAYAAYSKQLAFVATMLDKPERHMARYSKTLRAMSVEFGQSTKELSDGLYDILSAGFAADGALKILRVSAGAALGGMTDTKTATEAIVSVLLGYGLAAEHAAEVSDALFMTVKRGRVTFGELASDIGKVASIAAALGIEMDHLMASIAVISKGLKGPEIIVALNNILAAFYAPGAETEEMAALLKKAGIADVSMEGIRETPGGFRTIMKTLLTKLGPKQLAELFPSKRAMKGVMPWQAALKDFDMIFDSWADKLGEADNAMEKVRASFGFFIDQLKQAGVLVFSYMGEALAGSIKGAKNEILYAVVAFGKFIKDNKELIVLLAKLSATLLVVGAAIFALGKIIAAAAVIMQVWNMTFWGKMGLLAGFTALVWITGVLTNKLNEANQALKEMTTLGKKSRKEGGIGSDTAEFREVKRLENLMDLNIKKQKLLIKWKKAVLGKTSSWSDDMILGPNIGRGVGMVHETLEQAVGEISKFFGQRTRGPHEWSNREAREAGIPGGGGIFLPSEQKMQVWLNKTVPAKLNELIRTNTKWHRQLVIARKEYEKITTPIKEQIALEKERNALLASAGSMRKGQYLGYWRTPQTLWSSTLSPEDQSNEWLKKITDNTDTLVDTSASGLAERIRQGVNMVGE